MAIQIQDQGSVDLGRSRIQNVDTYSGAPNPGRGGGGGGLDELSNALAKFGVALQSEGEKKEDLRNKEVLLSSEKIISDLDLDNRLNLATRETFGEVARGTSPAVRLQLTSLAGQAAARKALNEEFRSIFADKALMENAPALDERLKTTRKKMDEFASTNPDLVFRGGVFDFYNKWENVVRGKGDEAAINALFNEAVRETDLKMGEGLKTNFKKDALFRAAASKVGIDPEYLVGIGPMEGGSGSVKNPYSSASGLAQIIDSTWDELVTKYGKQYGITYAMKNNDEAQAIMAAHYAKDNMDYLKKSLGRTNVTPGEVYLAHLLGPAGAEQFIKTAEANPNATPVSVVGDEKVRINPSIFKGKNTVGEVYKDVSERVRSANFYRTDAVRYDGKEPVMFSADSFASKHYRWTEFKNNGVYGGDGKIDSRLVNLLDKVTDQFGKKVTITSAFRNSEYNQKVSFSGANGPHTHGDAIDIDVKNLSDDEKKKLVGLFIANGATGVGHYSNGTIHVDLGASRQGKSRSPDGLSLWWEKNQDYNNGQKWFVDGVAQGKEWRRDGSVPAPGFNGMPMSIYEAQIRQAQSAGIPAREARKMLLQNVIALSTDTTDLNGGRMMLDDFSKNMRLTPEEQKQVNEAKVAIQRSEAAAIELNEKKRKLQQEALDRQITDLIDKDVTESLNGGAPFNPSKYMRWGSKYVDQANKAIAQAFVRPDVSAGNLNIIRDQLTMSNETNDWSFMGRQQGDPEPDIGEISDWVSKQTGINLDDRKKLLEEVPKLMEGMKTTQSQYVKDYFKTAVGDEADIFIKGPEGKRAEMLTGEPIRGRLLANYNTVVRNQVKNFITQNGRVPRGEELDGILERASGSAIKLLEAYKKNGGSLPKAPNTPDVNPVPGGQFLGTSTNNYGQTVDTYVTPDGIVRTVPRAGAIPAANAQYPVTVPPELVAPADQPRVDPLVQGRQPVLAPSQTRAIDAMQRQPGMPQGMERPQITPTPPSPAMQQIINTGQELVDWLFYGGKSKEQFEATPKLQRDAQERLVSDEAYKALVDRYNSATGPAKGDAYSEMARYAREFTERYVQENLPPKPERNPRDNVVAEPKAIRNK